MQFAERTAKLDTSIAELWLMLGPEYTGQKVPPVLKEARESGQEVQASIAKCKRMGAERNDE